MITLYSYPELFGLADNNPFGLKVFAFLKLAGIDFRHEHIFDASKAPRGQLPYIEEDGETVGDSDTIIAHLTRKHGLAIDAGLTASQRDTTHLVSRMLDDLYWVMSWSRWRDDRFWPLFRDAILKTHSQVTAAGMDQARAYNFERYRFQGIGRYAVEEVYRRGLADLEVLAHLIGDAGFVFAGTPSSIDAGIYGFLANIYYYEIETPLKAFVAGRPHLTRYIERVHAAVTQ
jgi:glutathione S-transferase